ncbi:hypothetical protein TREMEDRAFT_65514 [Tremella mesenterica DSM 1558]|uniref:uncharacterized protein n=1 Tax=Tremella mesenterica (strain ATCC 24925 / CBS 8224 / DSM 1558 / NBRC 9311 / NRRL Y-6157 / RJB 2259-6 / UBC 559-6) TaxID=578456 RepID=UPI00032B9C1F|nr:uncharacterized protein TREMEDRAFT_65514 [Tremella mesenterica DSM 1558]EIW66243.1 hypothetical protein TREMEDRAFT_65514 [Tremella mesenterica DSM 1558]
MGTNAALEKRLAELQETVAGLTKSIQEDRDKRETQNRPGMVRTEDRMVRTGEMITRTGYSETPGNGQYQPNTSRGFGNAEAYVYLTTCCGRLCPDYTRVVPEVALLLRPTTRLA